MVVVVRAFARRRVCLVVWACIAAAQAAAAQTLINPGHVTWQHTVTDYAQTATYEFGWYLSDTAPAPVLIVDIGKPVDPECLITAPTVTCVVALPQRPALGDWVVRIRAVGKNYESQAAPSGWSAPSNPFSCSLSAPGAVGATP